ncbi:unnamed protein product [Prunus armeniaca]
MSSDEGSRSLGSQVPLYLWGGSQVHKKRFVANLHPIMTEAQFQKWRTSFASAIPNDVHIRLAEPSTDDVAREDPNDPDARIITFRPFYFSLGFKFPMSKFFKKVFHAMGCAPSQCTPNVYCTVICFDNLNRFFKLGLTLREFFYFFKVRRCKKYAQLRAHKEKMFDSLSDDDHAWSTDVLEVSGRWEGVADDGPQVPITYCHGDDISKKIDLEPDMAKIHQAMNIPMKFREWRWLLSEHRSKAGGLPPARDIERWKRYGPNSDDNPDELDESSIELSGKRKVAPKLSRDEVMTSQARDVSRLMKKHCLPYVEIKHSSKEVSSAEKTQVRAAHLSSTRVKYTVGEDSKNVHDMRNIRDAMLKSSAKKFKTGDLPCKDVWAKPGSFAKKQRDVDLSSRSLSRLHQSNDEDRTEKAATSLGKRAPLDELQETKGRSVEKSSAAKFKTGDLPCKNVYAKLGSFAEKQRDADLYSRSLSHLHQSNDEDRIEKVATSLGKSTPLDELQETKGKADARLLTLLEARIEAFQTSKELSARAKGYDDLPKRTKSCLIRDVYVSDLFKTNFLARSSTCHGLVDHLRQAGDLGTFPSLRAEEYNNEALALIKNDVIFAPEAIQSSSIIAPFFAEFEKLEKKNAALSDLLLTEQTSQNMKILDLKRHVSLLKSSLALKDGELDSLDAALSERKEACLRIEHEFANLSQNYDKLLLKFETFQENTKESELSSTWP